MLGVTRAGDDITQAVARHTVSTGIAYAVAVPGLVAPYEEGDARIQAGYTLPAWERLGPDGRAWEVAHYRARRYVALHAQDAQAADAERQAKRH